MARTEPPRSACVSPKARLGAENGRTKLSDEQVMEIRLSRAWDLPQPTYRELATRFGLHPRHVKRICLGGCRRLAGGPIEIPGPVVVFDDGQPFDVTKIIRCPGCGARAHPSRDDPSVCWPCSGFAPHFAERHVPRPGDEAEDE